MKALFAITLLLTSFTVTAQEWKTFKFQTGDLLFQDIDCGELCDAIEAVTPGLEGKHFSHVGLAYALGDSVYVIEAIGNDVHLTSVDKFLQRQLGSTGKPKVVVGRLKKAYQRLNGRAVGYALKQRGTPYDDRFAYNNGKYYCSELIYDAYMEANDGRPFFNMYPMTFKDPKTGKTFPGWKNYFKQLGEKIPEGRQGCNPGSMAISDNVDIIASFY